MGPGITRRLAAWLVALAVPLACAALLAVAVVDQRLSENAEADVAHLLDLELARLDDALLRAENAAFQLSQQPTLVEIVDLTNTARANGTPRIEVVGNEDRPFVVDTSMSGPVVPGLATWTLRNGNDSGRDFREVTIIGRDGTVYDTTASRGEAAFPDDTVSHAMAQRRPLFGPAFRTDGGDNRLGIVSPIVTSFGEVVGAALIEIRLGSIVDLASRYEEFGATSEANIVQRQPDGTGMLITLRRFERDAALSTVLPVGSPLPSMRSLAAVNQQVVRVEDYRETETVAALQRIERTGWGVVVKIDQSEALSTSAELTRYIIVGSLLGGLGILIGWLLLVRPLGRRLIRTASAADGVAGGDYTSLIGDTSSDEIGHLARSIDSLAIDLDVEFNARSEAESALRVQHDRLTHEATHDALTNMFNRRAILDRVHSEIASATDETMPGLVYVDLDGFKEINDERGHSAGDAVIVEQSRRLSALAKKRHGWVGRLGGDEFLVVIPNVGNLGRLEKIGDEAIEGLADPVIVGGLSLLAAASAGSTLARAGLESEELLREADAALFEAKRTGRSRSVVATVEFRRGLALSAEFDACLFQALDHDEIVPWYQPIWRDGGTTLAGFEALVRWVRADGTIVSPAKFLPAAERLQLLPRLDSVIFEQVCKQIVTWRDMGNEPLTIHVNASTERLAAADFVDSTMATLIDTGCPPESIVIEVTESGVMEDVDATADKLSELRAIGIGIATDDFGKGYSSLSYLRVLPVDMVKIDREFIAGIDKSPQNQGVVAAVCALAVNFELDVVVEGIETVGELDYLAEVGDVELQGYLLGRPAPASEALALMGRSRSVDHDARTPIKKHSTL